MYLLTITYANGVPRQVEAETVEELQAAVGRYASRLEDGATFEIEWIAQ